MKRWFSSVIKMASFCRDLLSYKARKSPYTELHTHKIGKRKWRLLMSYHTPHCVVPDRFESNGASSPRLLWAAVCPCGEFFEASVVHDYMLEKKREERAYTLSECNLAFYCVAIDHDANRIMAIAAYILVSLYTRIKDLL